MIEGDELSLSGSACWVTQQGNGGERERSPSPAGIASVEIVKSRRRGIQAQRDGEVWVAESPGQGYGPGPVAVGGGSTRSWIQVPYRRRGRLRKRKRDCRDGDTIVEQNGVWKEQPAGWVPFELVGTSPALPGT